MRDRSITGVRRPETAFVFPAGGSAGSAQVGIAGALLERGIVPDLVVGCSVGALNAAFLAMDPTSAGYRRLARVWTRLRADDVFGRGRCRTMANVVLRRSHIYDPLPLRTLIETFCPMRDLADAPVAVQVVTTDLDLGLARWWGRGPAVEILSASAGLPGLLPPVILEGRRHVDGGVLDPIPVRRAVDLDAAVVYLLGEPGGPADDAPAEMTALDVLIRSFAISRYAPLPDPVSMARAGQRVVVVPGAPTHGLDLTDFSRSIELIEESYAVAGTFLDDSDSGDASVDLSERTVRPASAA